MRAWDEAVLEFIRNRQRVSQNEVLEHFENSPDIMITIDGLIENGMVRQQGDMLIFIKDSL